MRLAFCACAALCFSACGGGSSPVSPTPAPPAAASITVTLASIVKVKQTVNATATISSGGSSHAASTGWTSDTPAVAKVTDGGAVTGVSNGRATISISAEGGRGQQSIRVVPDYQGQWQGTYAVGDCTQTGDFARLGFCAALTAETGGSLPVLFRMSQDGASITGTFVLGVLESTSYASAIDADGAATFSGSASASNQTTIQVDWKVEATGADADSLTGDYTQTWRTASLSGTGQVTGKLSQVVRVSSTTSLRPAGMRPGSSPARGGTLRDLIRLIR